MATITHTTAQAVHFSTGQSIDWDQLRINAVSPDADLAAWTRGVLADAEPREQARLQRESKAPAVRVVYGRDRSSGVWYRSQAVRADGSAVASPLRSCGGTVATLALSRADAEAMAQKLGIYSEEVADL